MQIENPTEHLPNIGRKVPQNTALAYPARMLRATLRRAVGHGAEAASLGLRLAPRWHGLSTAATMRSATVATKRTPSLGLRLAPRWHGLSTVATKRTLTLEEAMTSSHMILQTLESPTTLTQVGEAAWLGLGLLGLGCGRERSERGRQR